MQEPEQGRGRQVDSGRGGRRGSRRLATELRAPAEHGEHAVQSPGPSPHPGGHRPRRPGHRYLPWGRFALRLGSGNRRQVRIPAIVRRPLNPRAPGFWVELRSLATLEPERGGAGRGGAGADTWILTLEAGFPPSFGKPLVSDFAEGKEEKGRGASPKQAV